VQRRFNRPNNEPLSVAKTEASRYNERTFILSRRPDDRETGSPRRPLDGRRPTGGLSGSGASPNPRGAKPLADILADLFAARGLARVQALGELEAAWADAVGEPGRSQTRVESLRRGVLSVTVAHPTLLEELASFQKPNLLVSLRRALGGTPIHDIRFRIGSIDRPEPPMAPNSRGRK